MFAPVEKRVDADLIDCTWPVKTASPNAIPYGSKRSFTAGILPPPV